MPGTLQSFGYRIHPSPRVAAHRTAAIDWADGRFTSAYVGFAANISMAIVDLPGAASQPGVAPPMPQAAIFFTLLAIVVPATLTAFGLVMYGMRGAPDHG